MYTHGDAGACAQAISMCTYAPVHIALTQCLRNPTVFLWLLQRAGFLGSVGSREGTGPQGLLLSMPGWSYRQESGGRCYLVMYIVGLDCVSPRDPESPLGTTWSEWTLSAFCWHSAPFLGSGHLSSQLTELPGLVMV